MIVTLTLDIGAGADLGTFDLYSNSTGSFIKFSVDAITRQQLLNGYTTSLVPDNTTIIRVTSIGNCKNSYDSTVATIVLDVKYGYLYNWFTVDDARNIANTGWSVPTSDEFSTLSIFLGDGNVSGGKLKETGVTYWNTPNSGATNEVGFNGKGAGFRSNIFNSVLELSFYYSQTLNSGRPVTYQLEYDTDNFSFTIQDGIDYTGNSIRLKKDTTSLTNGQTGTYTGNDGKVYRTICIGTQEWLADNLVETLYRDLSAIPEVTDDATWAGLVTGARCSYDNDENNAI